MRSPQEQRRRALVLVQQPHPQIAVRFQKKLVEVRELAQLGWDAPGQLIEMQPDRSERRQATEFARNAAGQLPAAEQ